MKNKLHGIILTSEQASEANRYWGMSLTEESLVINRLAATVIYLYEEIKKRPLGLDKNAIAKPINRIYVGWPRGYFITSLDSNFQEGLEEMIAELGPPTIIEFRAANEGWYTEE